MDNPYMGKDFLGFLAMQAVDDMLANKLFENFADSLPFGMLLLKENRNNEKVINDFQLLFMNSVAKMTDGADGKADGADHAKADGVDHTNMDGADGKADGIGHANASDGDGKTDGAYHGKTDGISHSNAGYADGKADGADHAKADGIDHTNMDGADGTADGIGHANASDGDGKTDGADGKAGGTDHQYKKFSEMPGTWLMSAFFTEFSQVANTGIKRSFERQNSSDGTTQWQQYDVVRLKDGLMVINENITAQKQEELSLRAAPDFLQKVINSNSTGISVYQAVRSGNGSITDFEWVFANSYIEKLAGASLIGNSFRKTFTASVMNGLFQKYKDVVEKGTVMDEDIFYIDKERNLNSWYHIMAERLGDGLVVYSQKIQNRKVADSPKENQIGQQKDAALMLLESNAMLKIVFDTSLAGISIFKAVRNTDGNITDFLIKLVNRKVEQQTGRTNLPGKLYLQEYTGANQTEIFTTMARVVETGETTQLEFFYNHEGFDNWFTSVFIKMDDGIIASTIDVTETRKAERRIQELNKELVITNRELESLNAELNTFNHITASDYSATLTQLYIFMENIIVNDAMRLSNQGRSNLRKSQAAIQKLRMLTDDLRGYMLLKEINFKKETLSLDTLMHDTINDFTDKLEKFHTHIDCAHLPLVAGYPFLISLLFRHLLENAIRFRKDGRLLSISVTCREDIEGNKVDHKNADKNILYHQITITDNGIGFKQEDGEKIFDIFYQLHEKKLRGSGVGLAVCRKIMEMHKGFITCEGNPGEGASFHCFFPALNN